MRRRNIQHGQKRINWTAVWSAVGWSFATLIVCSALFYIMLIKQTNL